ncbi:methionyl-tRNA formyltransferase [Colwellia hornerae]|uniref:Methionyl-tRNA formyltransferase n=1 Tax=Colwellia hornerae TaxID=89402 RepID=A0A5C6QKH5_9GAMM|nr:methionyl-tRNA formyltransferase [Colwellia hornerae]TWX54062.1 methionyl-tRNA formyltransferase [Colwellia hornerae]TWX60837.1 methionyl-tRNA formyltransferase [Colwellia hornerae]TWX69167.1 methionyl-tRNA formyltransferase [Colwellia hornerae]
MKIGYFADGPWSHEAIQLIIESKGLEISYIVPRFDTQDPVLKEWASKLGIPFIPCENVNSATFIEKINAFDADLLVSMSFNQILKKEIISLAKNGFINCHAGALPFYRGRNPLNWAIINGEKQFGITVHYVDEGIDTGDIVEQRLFPIALTDNYATLLEKAVVECANVLHSAIIKINRGKLVKQAQSDIHPVGTYFGIRTFGDELINFNWPAERIHNFIRAICTPGPNARCFIAEQEYSIIVSELIHGAPKYIATIGEVVGRNDKGVVIKVGDSTLLLKTMKKIDTHKETEKFIPSFRIGTRFRVNG